MPKESVGDTPPMPDGYGPVYDTGFNAYVGSVYKKSADEGATEGHFLFDLRPQHMNGGNRAHGGLLMTLADTALGATVAHAVGHMCATISLNCNLQSGAKLGERISIQTKITRQAKSVVFVEGAVTSEGRLILSAEGLWRITNPEKRP